jgi:glyoxylase-like metal-dependent hydrolase (beta-lactamase superfamily II)
VRSARPADSLSRRESPRPLPARVVSLLLLAAVSIPGAQAGAQSYETTAVADGVYQFRWEGHNAMFVVGDGAVAVFDPIGVEPARRLAAEVGRVAPGLPITHVIYSHSDADHATGANVLLEASGDPDAIIVAHERAVAPIVERADPDQPPPSVTFARRMTFSAGGREIQLHYLGSSHTDNLIVPFVPDAGVAFAVDFVSNDRMGYQDLPGWIFPDFYDAVSGLLSVPFESVVFGHGPPGDRATIHRQIEYYDDLTTAVRDAVERGWSEDRAAEEIRLPRYAGWDQYEDWFPLNVRAIHRWVSSGEG